jgi:hypothetical protein
LSFFDIVIVRLGIALNGSPPRALLPRVTQESAEERLKNFTIIFPAWTRTRGFGKHPPVHVGRFAIVPGLFVPISCGEGFRYYARIVRWDPNR